MGTIQLSRIISLLVLVVAAAFCLQPVLALNSSISITYRGSGGSYIGDTVIFDGHNLAGNITVLRLTGPGLPAGGVPVYDLNGKEGTGNPVDVNSDGSWRFVWYTSNIVGVEKMQTARYYITALDLGDPTQSSSTSIMMKKPDFYVVVSPNRLETGDYVQLLGTAERGNPAIHIQITDANGRVVHTYDTSAGETGYFNNGFHVDMPPGDYTVTISSPSVISTYSTTLSVIPPPTPASPLTANQSGTTPASTGQEPPVTIVPLTSPPPIIKIPASLPLSPVTTLSGLIIAGVVVFVLSSGRKNA